MTVTELQQETRSTRGRVPIFRTELNGEAFDIDIQEASLTFAAGEHDQVTISATSAEMEDTEGLLDSTLTFLFGQAPHIETWSGYITNVTEDQASFGSLSFTITVLGVTKVMHSGKPRFWTNKQIPNAVRDLAHLNLLGYSGHSHTHVWTSLAQTDESDWQVANKLARRIGWSLFNRYGVVGCHDPLKLFTNYGVYAVLRSGSEGDIEDRHLIDFQPTETAEVIAENLGTKYGYFTTADQVQIGTQPGTFKGYRFDGSFVIRNQMESATYLAALDSATSGWKQHAIARIWGEADLYPGMNVEIITTNTRFMRDKYDGRWQIKGAAHSMDRQQWQTALYLCRPGSDTVVMPTGYTPFWIGGDSNGRAKPTVSIEQGRWVSSWADRRALAVL